MPPSGFSSPVVAGALAFVGGCYRDLLREVQEGKYPSYEEAIKAELKKIELALATLHIKDDGTIVKKDPYFYDKERGADHVHATLAK